MTDALMKYETIDRSQIDDIMAGKEPQEPEGWSDIEPSDSDDDSSVASEQTDAEEEKEQNHGMVEI